VLQPRPQGRYQRARDPSCHIYLTESSSGLVKPVLKSLVTGPVDAAGPGDNALRIMNNKGGSHDGPEAGGPIAEP